MKRLVAVGLMALVSITAFADEARDSRSVQDGITIGERVLGYRFSARGGDDMRAVRNHIVQDSVPIGERVLGHRSASRGIGMASIADPMYRKPRYHGLVSHDQYGGMLSDLY